MQGSYHKFVGIFPTVGVSFGKKKKITSLLVKKKQKKNILYNSFWIAMAVVIITTKYT